MPSFDPLYQSPLNKLSRRRVAMCARFLLVAAGAGLVTFGALAPMSASAQVPPPSVPDLGLPPATTRPVDVQETGAVDGGSSQESGGDGDGSFVAGALVGALILALGLGAVIVGARHLRRNRRRPHSRRRTHSRRPREPQEQWTAAPADGHAMAAERADGNQEQSEFLARVSHEMRAPLKAVKACVDTVRLHWGELHEARRRDLLDRASANADELTRLVGHMRDFARLDVPRVRMRPQPILVAEAVERTVKDLGPALADHDVYLDIPQGMAMLADVAAFGEVLTNLLVNAATFSPAGRRIIVSATLVDGAVDIAVADEGRGIPRDEQERIFEPYYQSPSTKASRRGARTGPGTGLTIARRLTEMQDGRIAVASEPGVGTTFWVTMPATAGPVRKIRDAHQESPDLRSAVWRSP